MTSKELHEAIFYFAENLAKNYGFKKISSSTKQEFLLGSFIPNPDNLLQDVIWKDGENKIEFRHRFSNICVSINLQNVFAEAEYNLTKDQLPCLNETHTWGGRAGLILLDQIINNINF